MVQAAPSLAGLAAGTAVAANPADLDRLGVGAGDRVKVSSARGSLTLADHARRQRARSAPSPWRCGQGDPSPTVLIDASAAVTDVRVETIA